jgi:hypothetical protein
MLNKVRQYAMEKFAGDKNLAEDFVKGFAKEAMSTPRPQTMAQELKDAATHQLNVDKLRLDQSKFDMERKTKDGLGPARSGFMNEVGKGMGNLVLTLGIAGVGKVYNNISMDRLHTKFLAALEKAIQSNHLIGEADRSKVMQYANTLFKFAPNIATDVNVLTSVLSNAIHGEGIDPATIKALTDIEGRFAENDSFSPKTYI